MALKPTSSHIALHEQVPYPIPYRAFERLFYLRYYQFTNYCSTPLLLLLTPSGGPISTTVNAQTLPFKAYEPTIEIRDRKSRSVFIEAAYNVQTGEAERIAVDWTARGGGGGTSRELPFSILDTTAEFTLST